MARGCSFKIHLSRAIAHCELGQYEQAYEDIETILVSKLDTNDQIRLEALMLKSKMKKAEKISDNQIRGNMIASSSNIFSSNRGVAQSNTEGKVNNEVQDSKLDHIMKKLQASNSKHLNKNTKPIDSEIKIKHHIESSSSNIKKKDKRLDSKTVDDIQAKQLRIFSSPETQALLEKNRFECDLEEIRFLHRLQPLKLKLQRSILEEYGFPTAEVGIKELERAIGQHHTRLEVRERSKNLMIIIMGDVW